LTTPDKKNGSRKQAACCYAGRQRNPHLFVRYDKFQHNSKP